MVPVVTRAPNITNISCWKIAPKPLVYIDPRILLNYCTLISGETIQDWIERYFSNSGIFPKFRSLFHQSVPHCLRFYLCDQIAGNPGTTVVSIGHLTPWPQNPGYRTQVWDNIPDNCGHLSEGLLQYFFLRQVNCCEEYNTFNKFL